ncbi:hypothetical protein SAY87_027191 [Trapa incisa]|uniref:Uncharacterized protein n=1 Tax=Trapa incisa TaxID=236973 RepID=A0AAN7H4G7_9MYRT|nr:hypothetical protein SAY87_027191 [Trapa incisa]
MEDQNRLLEFTLVPLGLLILFAYHLWLLYRIVKHPTKTFIGVNAISRRFWVLSMMEDVSKNGVLAVQTLRNNIMASTLLASTAVMLSSLIAILMASGKHSHSSFLNVLGERSQFSFSVKVLLHPPLLPHHFPLQCAVRKVLQPWEYTDKRAVQENVVGPPAAGGHGGVRGGDHQQGRHLLVHRSQGLLLLLPHLPLDLRPHPHVPQLLCARLHSLHPRYPHRFPAAVDNHRHGFRQKK